MPFNNLMMWDNASSTYGLGQCCCVFWRKQYYLFVTISIHLCFSLILHYITTSIFITIFNTWYRAASFESAQQMCLRLNKSAIQVAVHTHFSNTFFVILHILLVLMFIYCWCKYYSRIIKMYFFLTLLNV